MDPELQALQQAIQVLHQLMQILQDPQAVNVVATCVKNLTGLQQQMMQGQQQPQAGGNQQQMVQALASRLQGGAGPQAQAAY
jgi:hypothetical protein